MMAMMKGVLAGAILLAGLAAPTVALDLNEAERVVGLMETLSEELGLEVYYGAGEEYLEADYDGAIAAAGFQPAGWVASFDAVVSGYMASIAQTEFDAMFAEVMARLDESALAEEQKALIRADMAIQIAEAHEVRRQGAAHVQAVLPLADRLQVLLFAP